MHCGTGTDNVKLLTTRGELYARGVLRVRYADAEVAQVARAAVPGHFTVNAVHTPRTSRALLGRGQVGGVAEATRRTPHA